MESDARDEMSRRLTHLRGKREWLEVALRVNRDSALAARSRESLRRVVAEIAKLETALAADR
jgi:hypothetical protein